MTTLVVGLPLASLSGDVKSTTQSAARAFLSGRHVWQSDGQRLTLDVDEVVPAPQPVGALFDWLLDGGGKFKSDLKGLFARQEIGVINIGFNTLDLLSTDCGQTVERLTSASQLGVRRLLELSNRQSLYTLAELDAKLRSASLDTSKSLPIWADEVKGLIDSEWGNVWRRFSAIVISGGGAVLLRDVLSRKFGAVLQFPDDSIISTARGLYKYALMKKHAQPIAIDLGFGNVKVYGPAGSVVMPAAVSVDGRTALGDIAGLKSAIRPLHITAEAGQFYVGAGAHKFGRPVQSLDLDRVSGSPETSALLYGALSKYTDLDLAG